MALAAIMSVQTSNAQTADEVIDKYVAAMDGREKLLALKSVKINGSLNVQGMDVGITITAVNNVGALTDISVPGMAKGFKL